MAYRLTRRKRTAQQLSRIVAREFGKALEELGGNAAAGGGDAVHEARKSVKKIRAVLRLLQASLGKDYRIENQRLRAIAHHLSFLRDVDATAEMLQSVRNHYPGQITPSIFAGVRRGLAARKRGAVTRLDPSRRLLPRTVRELRRLAHPTARRIRHAGGSAAIRAGILHGYRRARKALGSVRGHPEDGRFHTWRRRVKDHWYQVRLLDGLNAHARIRARRLKQLEAWLGDDHNLVLLRATVLKAPARFGDEEATTVVLGCITKYHTTLRRRALKLGDRLFAAKPRDFRRSIDGWLNEG
jgi:CHAD domain-containing protein